MRAARPLVAHEAVLQDPAVFKARPYPTIASSLRRERDIPTPSQASRHAFSDPPAPAFSVAPCGQSPTSPQSAMHNAVVRGGFVGSGGKAGNGDLVDEALDGGPESRTIPQGAGKLPPRMGDGQFGSKRTDQYHQQPQGASELSHSGHHRQYDHHSQPHKNINNSRVQGINSVAGDSRVQGTTSAETASVFSGSIAGSSIFPPSRSTTMLTDSTDWSGRLTESKQIGQGGHKKTQYHKTKLCPWHKDGKCFMAENCNYAHSREELRPKPDLSRTKLCPEVVKGRQCTKAGCRFAHDFVELRATSAFFKTRICKFWQRGYCPAGGDCRHAHGKEDLRNPLPSSALPSTTASGSVSARTSAPKPDPAEACQENSVISRPPFELPGFGDTSTRITSDLSHCPEADLVRSGFLRLSAGATDSDSKVHMRGSAVTGSYRRSGSGSGDGRSGIQVSEERLHSDVKGSTAPRTRDAVTLKSTASASVASTSVPSSSNESGLLYVGDGKQSHRQRGVLSPSFLSTSASSPVRGEERKTGSLSETKFFAPFGKLPTCANGSLVTNDSSGADRAALNMLRNWIAVEVQRQVSQRGGGEAQRATMGIDVTGREQSVTEEDVLELLRARDAGITRNSDAMSSLEQLNDCRNLGRSVEGTEPVERTSLDACDVANGLRRGRNVGEVWSSEAARRARGLDDVGKGDDLIGSGYRRPSRTVSETRKESTLEGRQCGGCLFRSEESPLTKPLQASFPRMPSQEERMSGEDGPIGGQTVEETDFARPTAQNLTGSASLGASSTADGVSLPESRRSAQIELPNVKEGLSAHQGGTDSMRRSPHLPSVRGGEESCSPRESLPVEAFLPQAVLQGLNGVASPTVARRQAFEESPRQEISLFSQYSTGGPFAGGPFGVGQNGSGPQQVFGAGQYNPGAFHGFWAVAEPGSPSAIPMGPVDCGGTPAEAALRAAMAGSLVLSRSGGFSPGPGTAAGGGYSPFGFSSQGATVFPTVFHTAGPQAVSQGAALSRAAAVSRVAELAAREMAARELAAREIAAQSGVSTAGVSMTGDCASGPAGAGDGSKGNEDQGGFCQFFPKPPSLEHAFSASFFPAAPLRAATANTPRNDARTTYLQPTLSFQKVPLAGIDTDYSGGITPTTALLLRTLGDVATANVWPSTGAD